MKRTSRYAIVSLIVALVTLVAAGASAESFVSFNGKFAITYPAGWDRLDTRTVDYYLQQNQATAEMYLYEAVFAPATSNPFYAAEYLIVTVDTVGALSTKQVDSVKELLSKTFGKDIKYAPQGNFLTNLASDQPTFDASTNTMSVLSRVTEGGQAVKRNLMVMKFYDRGIANFFFYAPDSLMDKSIPEFKDIVASFTTDIQSALPKEEVKVTKAEPEKKKARWNWVPYSGLFVILLIVIIRLRRRRANK